MNRIADKEKQHAGLIKKTGLSALIIFVLVSFYSIPVFAEEPDIVYSRECLDWGLAIGAFGGSLLLEYSKPWPDHPLIGGASGRPYHEETVSMYWLYGGAAFMTGFICLVPNRNGFFNRTSYTNAKGFIQALAFTTLTTSFTKNIFARKRPSYANYPANERDKDARKSFISGHASTSFCMATYGSMFIYSTVGDRDNPWHMAGKITSALALHSLAGYVAWTRVDDNRHHPSDVVAGGLAGSTIAALVFLWHNGLNSIYNRTSSVNLSVLASDNMTGLCLSRLF